MSDFVESTLEQLTLEEKASLCSGSDFWHLKPIDRLGIRPIMVTDGPHGLRKQATESDHVGPNESVPSTCFPTAVGLAATWNPDLVARIGEALAEECLQEGVSVLLGPGVNIKRSPLCGRNFEYFSEDPLLTGTLAAAFIDGVQRNGVGTSLKHFAANNQEYCRLVSDSIVDERTLREIYLRAFEIAVRAAQPWTVMCSYNRINGTYACENQWLLGGLLKGEWGHTGLVVTDWGAINDRVPAIEAGCELEMPSSGGANDRLIVESVRSGALDGRVLDDAVRRILSLIERSTAALRSGYRIDAQSHHELAREAAAGSMVLLKNDRDVLPLAPSGAIAVIGELARTPRYQGNGSSLVNPLCLESPLDEIAALVGADGRVEFAPGYSADGGEPDPVPMDEAVKLAERANAVIIVAGLPGPYESEGYDRSHMRLPPDQDALIDAVLRVRPDAVIVLSNGSPIEMPWVDRAPAILEAYLGGEGAGSAIAGVLFGVSAPSGKLAETFPISVEDTPSRPWFPGTPRQVQYREALYVGYRYYDSFGVDVLFPFGHGLTYTSFEYRDLQISPERSSADHDVRIIVRCTIENVGRREGREIVQLYVHDAESTLFRPEQELRAFTSVTLAPGEATGVEFTLDHDAFAYFDAARSQWIAESGVFDVRVGASSRDIRLRGAVELAPSRGVVPVAPEPAPVAKAYRAAAGARLTVDDAAFEALLGHPVPPQPPVRPFTINSTLEEVRSTFIGRLVYRRVVREVRSTFGADAAGETDMIDVMIPQMPLRALILFGGGAFTYDAMDGLLDALNGKPVRGLLAMIRRS